MPELPEVETIRTELSPYVLGREINGVTLYWDRMVREPSVAEFRARVIGQRITALGRLGKYLLFHLSGGEILVMHMKMTGSLLIDPEDDRFTRAILHLDNGSNLHFWDPRKFGAMWLIDDEKTIAAKLGPEPLEEGFTIGTLAHLLKNRTAPVKAVLLDQSIMAGIGNMYADEALFAAKLHPTKPAGSLTTEEITRLYDAIRQALWQGLKNKGASVRNYIRPGGSPGTAHAGFKVAHGVGKTCPNCGTPINRIVVRGRGSYICPVCQPAP